jgi:hypothetical protein
MDLLRRNRNFTFLTNTFINKPYSNEMLRKIRLIDAKIVLYNDNIGEKYGKTNN